MGKVLFVLSGAGHWTLADGTRHPTGFWAEEAVAPYEVFKAAGHEIVAATPGGVAPTADPGSLAAEANGGQENADRIAGLLTAATELREPVRLEDVRLEDYAAVFYPGGHGPMEDLPGNADSGRLLAHALESGKPLGLVCHGPAALLAAGEGNGGNPFAGRRLAAFTNAEEEQAGLADKAPWLLEDRLTEAGIRMDRGAPWEPHVVNDGTLVTGQNPASAAPLATALLKVME